MAGSETGEMKQAALRRALGQFATGVTVITAQGPNLLQPLLNDRLVVRLPHPDRVAESVLLVPVRRLSGRAGAGGQPLGGRAERLLRCRRMPFRTGHSDLFYAGL